ncbi:hypothetical protein B1992_08815 [Pseudoxanthomonas broegbernensis]|uniref:Uncharacterized protein n=2 Tax=Pseudoxanthomonas broegbernensis TaxID=83619 RepID=A0A7V8K799_9GAMM|nr:hypothetical protein B1992_08815 [Pseudoxanthomonas broegbernensis]
MLLAALPDARAQAAPADPALEAYVSLERMLALNGRCHWLAGNTLEYRGLSNTRDERLAWLTASGKVLAASLAVQNLPQVVAGLPSCTGKEGEALGRQIRGIAGQVAVQWILRAYILQSPQFPDRDLRRDANPSADATDPQGRPHWFHGLSLLGGEREKLSAVVLGLQNPAQHGPQEIAWVEAQQKQALADALRWGRFSCKPWKGGIYHDAGTCPAIPMEDRQYRDYAQHWGTLVNDMAMAVSYRD